MMAACSKLCIPSIGPDLPLQDKFSISPKETVDENDDDDDDADSDFSVLNATHFMSTPFCGEHGLVVKNKKNSEIQNLAMPPQNLCKKTLPDLEQLTFPPNLHETELKLISKEFKCEGENSEKIKKSSVQDVKENEADLINAKDLKNVLKKYVCEQCKYTCKCKTDLLEHLKKHVNQKAVVGRTKKRKDKPNDKKALACKICGKKYKKSGSLAKHELEHEGRGQFKCRFCGEVFLSDAERVKHREKHHEKHWKCPTCHHTFATEEKLQTHVRWHENKELEVYVCNVCSKEFKLKVNLKIHVESKCGTDPQHVCKVCGKAFMTRGTLITHTLLHTGEKTFLCRFCGKSFRLKVEMQRHERSHTGEKPFVCKVCGKAFAHRESLVTHNTLHTGIRPYMCETCGGTFSCIGNLIKHKKTHRNTCGTATPKASHGGGSSARVAAKKAGAGAPAVPTKSDPSSQSTPGQRSVANIGIPAPSCYNFKQPSFEENVEWVPQQPFFNNHAQNERFYPSMDSHIIDKAFKSSHIYWGSGNGIMGVPQESMQHSFGIYNPARNSRHGMLQPHILYASSGEEPILSHRPVDTFLHNLDSNKVSSCHRLQNLESEKLMYSNYRHYNWDNGSSMCDFKQEGASLQRDRNRVLQHQLNHNGQQMHPTRDCNGINVPSQSVVDNHHSYQFVGENRQQSCAGPMIGGNESASSFISDYVGRQNPYVATSVGFGGSNALPVQTHAKHEDKSEYHQEVPNPGGNAINNIERQVLDKNNPSGQYRKNFSDVNHTLVKSGCLHEVNNSFSNRDVTSCINEKIASVGSAEVLVECNKVKSKNTIDTCEANESAEVRSGRERKQKCPIKCDLRVTKYMKEDTLSRDSLNNSDDSRLDEFVGPADVAGKDENMSNITCNALVSCSHCSLEFPDETSLLNHVLIHSKQDIKDENNDSEDENDSDDEKPLLQRFNQFLLEKKISILNSEKKFVCNVCKKGFGVESHLKRHLKTHASNPEVPSCSFCGKRYLNKACLLKHEAQHTSAVSLSCKECDERFDSRAAYKKHRLSHPEGQHPCASCQRTFRSAANLGSHVARKHAGGGGAPEMFACQLCGKQFKQKGNLKVHVDSRCGSEPRHVCKVCGKAFMSVGSLTTHFLLHTGEKTFLCRFCGKSFRLKVEMQRHERSHTGEKPFVCKVCGKAFAHRESLVTHNTIHTGIKPYMCEACGCTFSCIGNLIKHKQTHNKRCQNSEK
ncbi:uncharacterized protein LOC134537668 [Bacillus rossius redtenbacheri]|uniref:uncharacterized protein LOC134537668 n=1 Tax=Bacillus rossius redtenbacheri TaxID=93214 RepID=UPI002FDD922B